MMMSRQFQNEKRNLEESFQDEGFRVEVPGLSSRDTFKQLEIAEGSMRFGW